MSAILDSLPTLAKEPGVTINGKRTRVPARVALGQVTPNNLGTLKKLNWVLFPVHYSDKFYSTLLEHNLEPYCKLIYYQDLPVGNLVSRLEPLAPETDSSSEAKPSTPSTTTTPVPVPTRPHVKLYIMTLGILSPYRRQGLATKLLHSVLQAAERSHEPIPPKPTFPSQTDPHSNHPPSSKKSKTSASSAPPAKSDKDQEEEEEAAKKLKKKQENQLREWQLQAKSEIVDSVYVHVWKGNPEARAFWEKQGFEMSGEIKDYYRKIEPRDAWVLSKKITPKPE
ncbi:BZ3500_MvSof-1268-A1-R1_Chr2-1g04373 [Microbotryum saponariae]|uniref:BZ3500_MvSof-1268-A1-R1_Chr2-1g04373 protein n=1 Tax=Microbotryum saponariae TaxID=289078 RepID=A0A2X0MBR0_9BASI|nr:BZ3500_MvSof-1268-A1-R1_Chr2-1g04373 [Microbotryum saponariae]SCZ91580.1 BZ3501_MvSof-1269-A2-R1_Chr2-1g04029 [Microbotryum saponariae]